MYMTQCSLFRSFWPGRLVCPDCGNSTAFAPRFDAMIDAVLTNTVLPAISEDFLTSLMEAKPVERAQVGVSAGEFVYTFD